MRYTLTPARLLSFVIGWLSLSAGHALCQTPYYQGKVITFLRGGEPGGTGDLQARAMIPFLEKYLPGRPKIVELDVAFEIDARANGADTILQRRRDTAQFDVHGTIKIPKGKFHFLFPHAPDVETFAR